MNRNYLSFIFFSIAIFLLGGCDQENMEYNLEKSIFIRDAEIPILPIYSEWGYNTFGVLIDRAPFISNSYEFPSKVIIQSDTLNLLFKGDYNNNSNAILTFSLPNITPKEYSELLSLNDKTLDLSDTTQCIVTFKTDDKKEKLKILDGTFHIKKAQKLLVDKEFTEVILSGKFRFRAFLNNEPTAFNYGRFDLSFGYNNFFLLND